MFALRQKHCGGSVRKEFVLREKGKLPKGGWRSFDRRDMHLDLQVVGKRKFGKEEREGGETERVGL